MKTSICFLINIICVLFICTCGINADATDDEQSEYKYYISDEQQPQARDIQQQFAIEDTDLKSSTSSDPITGPSSSTMAVNQLENVTIKVGQQAVLPCFVSNLGSFKVIWVKNGDILALGSNKINSDPRLNVQHRYVSEWHLIIDNVVTDDEGEYICKTNGNFFKTINLQVLMPPTIDDLQSTPAGTITLREDSSITLRCQADGKPEPSIKWYRWKKYKHLISDKEELDHIGNEITIDTIKRTDPNIYECIAKNSVPPATSRIFNIEIHFLPTVELEIRKTFQFLHKKFSIECKISSNPLERTFWLKNGQPIQSENIQIEKYDISNINDYHKTLLTLTVMNANKEDFGEYECCATNAYGQICSNILVQEIKPDVFRQKHQHHLNQLIAPTKSPITNPTSISFLARLTGNDFMTTVKKHNIDDLIGNNASPTIDSDLDEKNDTSIVQSSDLNSMDSKDKRRHYLIKTKQFLHLESPSANTAATSLSSSATGLARPSHLIINLIYILIIFY